MPKIFFILLVLVSLFLLPFNLVFASGFQLTQIGNMNVTGAVSGDWWYTGENPVLSGKAPANDTVTINIDGNSESATADENGNWYYAPSTLTSGDHEIILTSNAGTLVFTLHAGQGLPEGVGGGSANTVETPVAGNWELTVLLLTAGIAITGGGLYLQKSRSETK
jgi:hypothetical protein